MANVFFIQPPNDVLRVVKLDYPIESDTMTHYIREEMKDLCMVHAVPDAYEENRIETCKGNLIVITRFLEYFN